jgi:hypothetical protein
MERGGVGAGAARKMEAGAGNKLSGLIWKTKIISS